MSPGTARVKPARPGRSGAGTVVGRTHEDGSQDYFWTKKWQAGEHEASTEIAEGRTKRFRSALALLRDLSR